ncbi:lectin subunit alpha-like [Calliphora vicina]|uniref:lectin subunit alpha-like n=1 Tax=Calliphora vicina TaxID=7373 RepID=UPI00325B91E1
MAKSSKVLLVTFLIFITKLYVIKGNENIFVSNQKNVYFIESEQKFTWYDGLAKCASMNMSLVTIDSKLKSEEITALLNDIFGKKTNLWMGGAVNEDNPRQFVWISTGRKFTYTNWANAQPDFASNNEYCAQTGWTNAMEWNDYKCFNKLGFMCEYSHQYQGEMQKKVQEEMIKQQQVELKEMVGQLLHGLKKVDGESRTFRDIVFNINPHNP